MYCPKCGAECAPADRFCPRCGSNLNPSSGYTTQNNADYKPMETENRTRPDNYLAWAILSAIVCCLPTGAVSIYYAAKVDSLFSSGMYSDAEEASRKARIWAIASAITGVVVGILYTIICLAVAICD